jgi:hypothetical protein
MQNNNQQLKEGLRPTDLQELVHEIFEVDSFKSKMGEDQDVCVVSFKVKDRSPAKDLMEFIEKGYPFVLDADVSSGEDNSGEYSVFVEISRSNKLAEQIKELTYGVKRLTGIDEFKFKYHKDSSVREATEENLKNHVPASADAYAGRMNRFKTEGIKRFFNKTLMDDLTLDGDIITFHKPFNKQIKLRLVSEDDLQAIVEAAPNVDDAATAETFWLTKVLGNYEISKFGDRFLFTNGNQSMILQRIEQ